MDNDYRAVIADFGLVVVLETPLSTMATSVAGTARWMAPELLVPEGHELDQGNPSKKSDVYAFGMVIYEVRVIMLLLDQL